MAKASKSQVFLWEGTDKQGARISGEVISTDPTLAKAALRQQGINPLKVRKKPAPLLGGLRQDKIKSIDIAIFTRQLATMLSAGIPVVQALEILSRGTKNTKLQSLIITIKNDIESGVSFSDALIKHPLYFNKLYSNLVQAGEQSGTLDDMLARIATYREKTESLKAKIKKAMYYPIAIIVIAFVITAGLLIFVVPQFEQVFKGFGADLPAATKVVIAFSEAFQAYWFIIFAGIGAAATAFVSAKRRSAKFAHAIDRLSLKIPIVGPILRKAAIARFARTLSITFAAGLPLVDALQSVSGATGNIIYSDATLSIRDDVATGKSIQKSMQKVGLFPVMATQMVGIGEEAGSLEFMLAKIADFYEEDVDNAVNSLSSLLEPLIMVVLGVIIGGLVVAMYLPIFKLGSVI